MTRYQYELSKWCDRAVAEIKYPPDRKAVHAELFDHATDHYESLAEKGLTEEEALQRTLDALGSAEAIAPELAAIHRPFWGYALRVSKLLLIILLILGLLPIWNYAKYLHFSDRPDWFGSFDIYDKASYDAETGRKLHHLSQPDVFFSSDGYRFTVTDAAVYTEYSEAQGRNITQLHILIDQSSMLPWTETERYYNTLELFSVCRQLTASDSLGNFYYSYAMQYRDVPCMQVTDCQSGLFTGTYECWINDFPSDAEWVDIHYERDGRSLTLRIDLTGGEIA